MKTRKITTTELPETYEELCRLLPPRKIEDKASYGNAMEVLDAMAGMALNRDQEEYLDLLRDLVTGYEDKTVEMPKVPVTLMGQEIGISDLTKLRPCLLAERLFYKGVTSWSKAMQEASVRA